MGANVAGGTLQAISALKTGQAQSSMYSYQSAVALVNKQIALGNRDYALNTGENEAMRYGLKGAQEKGALRANQGASGLDLGFGTSGDVREGEAKAVSMDLATIRRNAAKVAYGYSVEATNDEAQSTLYSMASSNALEAGKLNAAGSLISMAGSVSDKWLKASSAGVPGFSAG